MRQRQLKNQEYKGHILRYENGRGWQFDDDGNYHETLWEAKAAIDAADASEPRNSRGETMAEFAKRVTPHYLTVTNTGGDEWDVRNGSVILGYIEAHEPDEAVEQAKQMFNKEVIGVF